MKLRSYTIKQHAQTLLFFYKNGHSVKKMKRKLFWNDLVYKKYTSIYIGE